MVDTKEESIFGDKQSSKSSKNFKVVVRVRPLIKRELSSKSKECQAKFTWENSRLYNKKVILSSNVHQ